MASLGGIAANGAEPGRLANASAGSGAIVLSLANETPHLSGTTCHQTTALDVCDEPSASRHAIGWTEGEFQDPTRGNP